jgi:DNA-binding transcriptional ArsR family regulator
MQNTNNTLNNFPKSFALYFANKPEGMSFYQYFFSIINPHRFPYWVIKTLYLIIRLCKLENWTIARIGKIAWMVGKSKRTVQRTLRSLVAIGLVEEMIVGNHRRYRVNQTNFDILLGKYKGNNIIKDFYDEQITQDYYTEKMNVTPDVTPEFPESPFDIIDYEVNFEPTLRDCNNHEISLSHQKDDLAISDPVTLESDKIEPLITLDPIEIEIKQEFEAITGKTLNLKKNRKPLTELKEIAKQTKDIVVLAFKNVANHIAEKGTQVYNLGYVLTAAKNLMHPKATPKTTPRDYAPASEQDKAHAAIGGDPAKHREKDPLETPEQKTERLTQESKAVQLELKHDRIKTEFYNDLPNEVKNELIQKEIELMKTQSIWEKIKPQYSWSFDGHIVNLAIDRVKNALLEVYLDHQAFLTTQLSG